MLTRVPGKVWIVVSDIRLQNVATVNRVLNWHGNTWPLISLDVLTWDEVLIRYWPLGLLKALVSFSKWVKILMKLQRPNTSILIQTRCRELLWMCHSGTHRWCFLSACTSHLTSLHVFWKTLTLVPVNHTGTIYGSLHFSSCSEERDR